MGIANDLEFLFHRDLTRLVQQLQAFPDDASLWRRAGTVNTGGNLVLHLEGNLREFIGRQLGHVAYTRNRTSEFATTGISAGELVGRIEDVRSLVSATLLNLSPGDFDARFPEDVLGMPLSTQAFLIHLHGHLNYHLGQLDYLRRLAVD